MTLPLLNSPHSARSAFPESHSGSGQKPAVSIELQSAISSVLTRIPNSKTLPNSLRNKVWKWSLPVPTTRDRHLHSWHALLAHSTRTVACMLEQPSTTQSQLPPTVRIIATS